MTTLLLLLAAGLVFPWGPMERGEAPQELYSFLEEGRWEDAGDGLRDLMQRDPSARWMYLTGRLEESRARWWESWRWYARAASQDEEPWSRLAAARWVRLELRLPVTEDTRADVWAVFPIQPLGRSPQESAVARSLTHYLVRHLNGASMVRALGPRQLVRLKVGPSFSRGALPPAHTPAGMAARLSLLPAPESQRVPYLDPSRSEDELALEGAIARFQTQERLTPTGRPDGPTAVALERALTSWLARETTRWTPEETEQAARLAGAQRILQGSLQELPEGGFRWTLALVDGERGAVVAGPYEGWLTEGRFGLEWDAALSTLGAPRATTGGESPWGPDVPEKTVFWEAWGAALAAEDGRDPVANARAYALPAQRYGAQSWGLELRYRALGWNIPLAQVGAEEEGLLRVLARGRRELEDAARRSRSRMLTGVMPGDGILMPDVPSAPLILGNDGRLVLEGRVPR